MRRNGTAGSTPTTADTYTRTTVSKPGAVVRVERIDMSETVRRSLTTGARRIGPSPRPSAGVEPVERQRTP